MTLVVMALLLLSLGVAGWTALEVTQTGIYSALDLQHRIQATYLAEAGLNHAMTLLSTREDIALDGLPYTLVPETVLGIGSYSATLENNPEDPGGGRDSDGILIVSAVGRTTGQRLHRRATSRITLGTVSLSVPGAASLGAGTVLSLAGRSMLSGYDSSRGGGAVAGAAFETPDQQARLSRSATITGIPDQQWAEGVYKEGGTYSDDMRRLLDNLALRDTALHPATTLTGEFGTSLRPRITVIDPGKTLSTAAPAKGKGILIVQGTLEAGPGFSFSGLILIDAAGHLDLSGNAEIQGGVVSMPSDASREVLTLSDSARIQYSSSALSGASAITRMLSIHSYRLGR